MPNIQYVGATTPQEIRDILALQQANLSKNISPQTALEQGFLTVEHDYDLLWDMNHPYGHTIAKAGEQVAGFALTMTTDFVPRLPILKPMVELVNNGTLSWNGVPCRELRWVIMGQVCVHIDYRGQGVFEGLYQAMRTRMQPHFDVIITEISARNTRSMRAHAKAGLQELHRYTADDGQEWVVVGV